MAKTATAKKVNYTDEMTQDMVNRYTNGETVESIASSIGKTVRSVRAKLVREGAYVAPEKPAKVERDLGPTKKEMIRELESLWPGPHVEGFANATKEAVQAVIDLVRAAQA